VSPDRWAGDVREGVGGGVVGSSSLSGKGDGHAIVVVGGVTAGMRKWPQGVTGWVVCCGDVVVFTDLLGSAR
jgi:hypothetical protein